MQRELKALPGGVGTEVDFERLSRHLLAESEYGEAILGRGGATGRGMVLGKEYEVLGNEEKSGMAISRGMGE